MDGYTQVVHRSSGDEEKLTLYIQAVHTEQKMDWIKDVRKGLHTYYCFCSTDQ